jgi:hypothetical protein
MAQRELSMFDRDLDGRWARRRYFLETALDISVSTWQRQTEKPMSELHQSAVYKD